MPLMHASAILCLVVLATVAGMPAEAASTGSSARQVRHVSRTQIIRIGEPRAGIRTIGGGPAAKRLYDSRRNVIRIGQSTGRGLRLGQNLPSVQKMHRQWLGTGGFRR